MTFLGEFSLTVMSLTLCTLCGCVHFPRKAKRPWNRRVRSLFPAHSFEYPTYLVLFGND